MFTSKDSKNNIIKYRKQRKQWRIEHFVFLAIFIYLICNIIISFSKNETSVYQVYEGSIIRDTAYTGIAIREEAVYTSENSGYIQYYYTESSKVSTGSNIYTLSEDELKLDPSNVEEADSEIVLSTVEKSEIFSKVQAFNQQFSEREFSAVTTFKDEVNHILDSANSDNKLDYLNDLVSQNQSSVIVSPSADDGIILYHYDGFESFDESDLTPDVFSKQNYEIHNLSSNTLVNTGDPTYKLITDEAWTIYILLSDTDIEELSDINRLEVKFLKDNLSMKCNFSIIKMGDASYGKLEFNSGMVRYSTDRYLELELILDNQEGLKIPVSSTVEKEFFQVPNDFIQGNGIMVKQKDDSVILKNAKIYYQDENYSYISTTDFLENDELAKSDSVQTYTLGATKTLTGVYIINRGYAIFQYVNILASSEEYHIVEYTANGLDNYDNIALYGSSINENEVIF